jgi:hypothetical protein
MSQQINLFNPIFLKKKKYFSAVTMVQALGIIFVGAMLLGAYAKFQLSSLQKEAAATAAQLTSVQARVKKVNAEFGAKQKTKSLEDELQKAESELSSLQKIFAILDKGEFGNTNGYAEYMRAFARQAVNGVWLTGFGIQGAGTDIALQGRALKPELVPAYITRLRNEPVLQGKSFSAFEMQTPQAAEGGTSGQVVSASAAPPNYIEFRLHSFAAPADSIKDAITGGKAK